MLANCQIKQSRINSDDLEIPVTPKTELGMSPKKYTIDETTLTQPNYDLAGKRIALADIVGLPVYERVTVEVKICDVTR